MSVQTPGQWRPRQDAGADELWALAAAETHTDEDARQRYRALLAHAGLLRRTASHHLPPITERTA